MLQIRDHGTRIHIAIKDKQILSCDHGPSVEQRAGKKSWCTVWLPFCFNPLNDKPMDEETEFIDRWSRDSVELPVEVGGDYKRYQDYEDRKWISPEQQDLEAEANNGE